MTFEPVARDAKGNFTRDMLDTNDAYILDTVTVPTAASPFEPLLHPSKESAAYPLYAGGVPPVRGPCTRPLYAGRERGRSCNRALQRAFWLPASPVPCYDRHSRVTSSPGAAHTRLFRRLSFVCGVF